MIFHIVASDEVGIHLMGFDFFKDSLSGLLTIGERDSLVEQVRVYGEGFSNPDVYHDVWKNYTSEAILRLYGPPSRIWLQTFQNQVQPPDPTYKYYQLLMFYDEKGFVAIYDGKIENKPEYLVCPTSSGNLMASTRLILRAFHNQTSLDDLLGQEGDPSDSLYSLQDISPTTIDEFYRGVINDTQSFCFATQSDIWPK